MSFSSTPLGQGRRLDHNTFHGKPSSSGTTTYTYGPPPLGSRSPPQDENDGALARFARLKQQAKPPSQPKVIASPPRPEKWSVKDTSVNIATAFTQAASGDMNTSTFSNPNNAWASGSRQNLAIPRSTSVEYEASASVVSRDRRLAPPPPRLANTSTGNTRKPPTKQTSFRSVADSEGEEDRSLTLNGRAKSPFETSINYARQALETAVYYVRQRSQEPSGEQNPNGNTTNESSYDYAAEEQAFQSAKKLSSGRRGRISTDNKAYKPTQSEDEYSSEYSDDGKKRRKKTKKIKGLKLPIMGGEKRRKKKTRGPGGGPEEDEESESDDNSQEMQSHQVRTSLPPASRASVSRASLEPPSISIDNYDDSTSFAEQGLQSIPEVEEELLLEAQRAPSRPRDRPRSRSRSRQPASPPPSNVSIGGLLGSMVNVLLRSGQLVGHGILALWNFLMYLIGVIVGNFIDLIIRRPSSWINASAGLRLFAKYFLPAACLVAAFYIVPETTNSAANGLRSYLPSISFGWSKSSAYIPSDIPPSSLGEFADRLARIEKLVSVLATDTQTSIKKNEDELSTSYSELLAQLNKLKGLEADTRNALKKEADARQGVVRTVNGVKQDMEVLHSQIKVQVKERELERKEREKNPPAAHTVVEVDEEARAKLRALEEKLGSVEGGVKEAIELSRKAVSSSQTQQQQSSKDAKDAAWWSKLASGGTKSGLQIKSADGQDVTSLISHLVTDAVTNGLTNTDNGVGRPDLASSSGGARVIPRLTSQTLAVQPASLTERLSSFFAGRSPTAFGRPPVTALHHETQNGHCWPFEGSQGQLGVALAAPTYVDAVTIDHVAKQLAFNMGSAPRDMEVWGMVEGEDNEQRVSAWREKRKAEAESRGQESPEEPEYPSTLDAHPEFLRLAKFTYDVNVGKAVQTFPVDEEVKNLGVDFGVVVLRILNNWGRDQFTCLYRFRVHGEIMMGAEEQDIQAHADGSS